ncbi:MAG: mechanosensitive ion channel family protein [Hyphomicrobiaceae bacterium]
MADTSSSESAPASPDVTEAPPVQSWQEFMAGLGEDISREFGNLSAPWSVYQFGIICAALLAALMISRIFTPDLEERLRHISGQPRLLRMLVILLRRLRWILFALLLWSAWYVLQNVTVFQSRSFYVAMAANLATAWVVISILSRIIRNRSVARLFAVSAWSVVALHIVGWLQPLISLLDGAAYSFGNMRISLLVIFQGVLLLTILIWLASIVGDFLDRRIKQTLDLAPSLQVLLGKLIKSVLMIAAVLVSLTAVGLDLTALTVFSGAVGLGVGFGLQKVASNLVSGIIILMDKSIKPGDVISLGETFGWISSLRGRYVSVVTRDGVEYLIPNEDFVTEKVVNWSYSNRNVRLDVHFGVSYDSDPHVVRKLAMDSIAEIERVIKRPAPVCHIVSFGDSSVDFVLRFWISDPEAGLTNIRGAAYLALWDAFKENKIDIPFPHRDVHVSINQHDAAKIGLTAPGSQSADGSKN